MATSRTLPPCYLLYRLYEKIHQLNIFKIKAPKIKITNITNCDCTNWLNFNCLKRKYHTKYLKMTISKMKMKNIINDLYVFRNVSCFMFLSLFFLFHVLGMFLVSELCMHCYQVSMLIIYQSLYIKKI